MPAFPDELHMYLTTVHGQIESIETLSGLSGAGVWRVRCPERSLIVKATHSASERAFYTEIAPHLRALDIPIPNLDWSAALHEMTWLILEDIPHTFPQQRWLADDEQLAILRRLHRAEIPAALDVPSLFQPRWNEAMTESACAWFPPSEGDELRRLLDPLRLKAQELFAPACLISGDPNPRNWGMRHDRSLGLFDWERFGRATPAIDVAITVPGFPGPEAFLVAARVYLQSDDPPVIDAFARQLAVAKTWTIVELLDEFRTRESPPDDLMRYLIDTFPVWLREIARITR